MPQTITVPIGELHPDFKGTSVPASETFPERLTVPIGDLPAPARAAEPPADDEGILGFAKHYWNQINPIALGQLLPFPKALGGAGLEAPLDAARNILKAQDAVKAKGDAAWAKGEHVEAAAHYLHWLLPVIGPVLDKAGEEMRAGKIAPALGDTTGLATAIFGPTALAEARSGATAGMGTRVPPGGGSALTAEELASNAFARAHEIPLDAATATGSRFVRGVQKVAGESMLGGSSAERARTAQTAALERVGGDLADQVKPGAVSPEAAGAGATTGLEAVVQKLRGQANEAYGRLRELESQAAPEQVPAPEDALANKGRATLQQTTLGYEPKPAIVRELRRIRAELDAYRYEGATWTDLSNETGLRGNAAGGHMQRTPGHAGAPVYDDILELQQGSARPTRAEVLTSIDQALETGRYDTTAKGALNVAELRSQGVQGRLSKPMLPPEAGDVGPGRTAPMRFAVDMRDAKAAVKPLYEQLSREAQIAPLMGGKADALRALDRLVNGPDHAPLSEADAARSNLDAIARTDDPLFRTAGQGGALKAARALDEAVQLRAASAGDAVYDALKAGRAATRAKYETGAVLDQLRDEPVATFQKLTAPRDQNIDLLRDVQQRAPDVLPDLGRAKLQQWLDLASERGRFDHVDRIYAEWQKLGDQTKRVLFRDPALVESLDRFFLLAKRIGENPNPSGTAGTALKTGEIVGAVTHPLASLPASVTLGALARLLYTPKGVEALTAWLETSGRAPGRAATVAASSARRAAALARVATVAKAEGVDLGLAADRTDQDR